MASVIGKAGDCKIPVIFRTRKAGDLPLYRETWHLWKVHPSHQQDQAVVMPQRIWPSPVNLTRVWDHPALVLGVTRRNPSHHWFWFGTFRD